MVSILTAGKRLIPLDHIAFVERYEPAAEPRLQSDRNFQARIVLTSRDSLLVEETVETLATEAGLSPLVDDNVAINPTLLFMVETFAPTVDFAPAKPFATRLRWRDRQGNEHSKLLVTPPEALLKAITGRIVASRLPAASPRGGLHFQRRRPKPRSAPEPTKH